MQVLLLSVKFEVHVLFASGRVGFLVEMWNSSCASILVSNGQYINSTYGRHVSLSNKIKFIMTVSSHQKEMAKKGVRENRQELE
jgi:hypothetical protein